MLFHGRCWSAYSNCKSWTFWVGSAIISLVSINALSVWWSISVSGALVEPSRRTFINCGMHLDTLADVSPLPPFTVIMRTLSDVMQTAWSWCSLALDWLLCPPWSFCTSTSTTRGMKHCGSPLSEGINSDCWSRIWETWAIVCLISGTHCDVYVESCMTWRCPRSLFLVSDDVLK